MSMRLMGAMCLVVASGCADRVTSPAPPAHEGPKFKVTTAPPSIGTLEFKLGTDGQSFTGELVLRERLTIAHPIRLALGWSREFDGTGEVQTLAATLDGRAGSQHFAAPFIGPSEAAIGELTLYTCGDGSHIKTSHGNLIAFVDVNDNGVLDLSETSVVDHVLGASNFPTPLFGATHVWSLPPGRAGYSAACVPPSFGGEGKVLLFDDPRLDVVACNRSDHFTAEAPCGVTLFTRPAVAFTAGVSGAEAGMEFKGADGVQIFVDDELKGVIAGGALAVPANAYLNGEHRLRAEAPGKLPWEATVTLPQPLQFLERPAVMVQNADHLFVWSVQGGVEKFTLLYDQGHGSDAIETPGGSGVVHQDDIFDFQPTIRVNLLARFTDFPGGASVQASIPTRR